MKLFVSIGLFFLSILNVNYGNFAIQNVFFFLAVVLIFHERSRFTEDHFKIFVSIFILIVISVLNSSSFADESSANISTQVFIYIKFLIFIIFFSSFKSLWLNEKSLHFLYYFIAFSSLIGLLIYFFGEPFATFRFQLLGLTHVKETIYVGQGERIVGLENYIFHFAYPVSVGPVLALYAYKRSENPLHILMLFLFILTILLNAERSTLGAALIVSFFFIRKFFDLKKYYFHLTLFVILIVVFSLNFEKLIYSDSEHGLNRFVENYQEGTDEVRLGKQITAIYATLLSPFEGADYRQYQSLTASWFGSMPTSPHNAFINIGFRLGVLGWISLFLYLRVLFRGASKTLSALTKTEELQAYYTIVLCYVSLAIVAAFHNRGVFNGDFISLYLSGMILAPYTNLRKKYHAD